MANSRHTKHYCLLHVVNCFQISNFVLWQTAENLIKWRCYMLWIAFKLVILSYGKQLSSLPINLERVVNCFQISNFVLWQTAPPTTQPTTSQLWIAFKLVILSYGKQREIYTADTVQVVNCFQISNFVLWQTAGRPWTRWLRGLWIAFKLVILSYGKQLCNNRGGHMTSCELLSN